MQCTLSYKIFYSVRTPKSAAKLSKKMRMRLDTKYGNGCSYDETLAPEDTDQKQ